MAEGSKRFGRVSDMRVFVCACVCVNVSACLAGLGHDVDDEDDVTLPMTRFSGCRWCGCPSTV